MIDDQELSSVTPAENDKKESKSMQFSPRKEIEIVLMRKLVMDVGMNFLRGRAAALCTATATVAVYLL